MHRTPLAHTYTRALHEQFALNNLINNQMRIVVWIWNNFVIICGFLSMERTNVRMYAGAWCALELNWICWQRRRESVFNFATINCVYIYIYFYAKILRDQSVGINWIVASALALTAIEWKRKLMRNRMNSPVLVVRRRNCIVNKILTKHRQLTWITHAAIWCTFENCANPLVHRLCICPSAIWRERNLQRKICRINVTSKRNQIDSCRLSTCMCLS